jgi:hypothetical protein
MKAVEQNVTRYADMFAALGAEPRLRIVRLLLSAHPDGMVSTRFRLRPASAARRSHTILKN